MTHAERARKPAALAGGTAIVALYLLVGGHGLAGYLHNYWLYRGFEPPRDPAFVRAAGTTEQVFVRGASIGGRRQQTYVYLPPGYRADSHRRYPVLYLLHGFPGKPDAMVLTVKAGVDEDVLLARGRMRPTIIVMPYGSTGQFTDKEWANGIRPDEGWETFVARDLVRYVDASYRTIATGRGRALAGLSEGGYGALNIALHHPGEFRVVESWGGYVKAANLDSIFGRRKALLAFNSPLALLPHRARALRRTHTYVWMYIGKDDRLLPQNREFAAELHRLRVAHRFLALPGGHNWGLWRAEAPTALVVASRRLAHA